jgi:predicted kinase
MLIIFGGLPGVGKSSIARKLAEKLGMVYLRIDSIEQAIKDAYQLYDKDKRKLIAEGYMTAYAVAKDNLEIGLSVVTDSVNPIALTRNEFKKIATDISTTYFEIEVICSDKKIHQQRIETRESTVPGLKLPTWQDVLNREHEIWESKNLTIDTNSTSIDESVELIISKINFKNFKK